MKISTNDDDPLNALRQAFPHVYEYVVVAKAINDEDQVVLAMGCSPTLNSWEVVGMLQVAMDNYQADTFDAINDDDGDDLTN
jgi:hypothetical protein